MMYIRLVYLGGKKKRISVGAPTPVLMAKGFKGVIGVDWGQYRDISISQHGHLVDWVFNDLPLLAAQGTTVSDLVPNQGWMEHTIPWNIKDRKCVS